MTRTRSWSGLTFIIATLAISCTKPRSGAHASKDPAWLERVDLMVQGRRESFEHNTEVLLRIRNKTPQSVRLENLQAQDQVALVYTDGTIASLHRLSVGVAKPIDLGPGETKRTSLLFQAKPGSPKALRVGKLELPVPVLPAN